MFKDKQQIQDSVMMKSLKAMTDARTRQLQDFEIIISDEADKQVKPSLI